jgi:hypothetical protein
MALPKLLGLKGQDKPTFLDVMPKPQGSANFLQIQKCLHYSLRRDVTKLSNYKHIGTTYKQIKLSIVIFFTVSDEDD